MPVAGCAAVIAAVVICAVSPLILTSLKLSVYDMTLPLEAAKNPSFAPVITDIDERSPATVRQWPWPRFTVAAVDSEAASFTGNARQSDDVTVLALKKTRKSQTVRTARGKRPREFYEDGKNDDLQCFRRDYGGAQNDGFHGYTGNGKR